MQAKEAREGKDGSARRVDSAASRRDGRTANGPLLPDDEKPQMSKWSRAGHYGFNVMEAGVQGKRAGEHGKVVMYTVHSTQYTVTTVK